MTNKARRKRLYNDQRGLCHICDEAMTTDDPQSPEYATIDHLVPLSRGGKKYEIANLMLAHQRCNGMRGTNSVVAARRKARLKSSAPHPAGQEL